jgi:hypothetical protein
MSLETRTDGLTERETTCLENCGPSGVRHLHGFLRGSVAIPEGLDLTAPVLVEVLMAVRGQSCG